MEVTENLIKMTKQWYHSTATWKPEQTVYLQYAEKLLMRILTTFIVIFHRINTSCLCKLQCVTFLSFLFNKHFIQKISKATGDSLAVLIHVWFRGIYFKRYINHCYRKSTNLVKFIPSNIIYIIHIENNTNILDNKKVLTLRTIAKIFKNIGTSNTTNKK